MYARGREPDGNKLCSAVSRLESELLQAFYGMITNHLLRGTHKISINVPRFIVSCYVSTEHDRGSEEYDAISQGHACTVRMHDCNAMNICLH